MNWTDLAKYFTHGIAFSFLFLVLAFVLVFVLVFLVVLGSFIGLIIGFGILMLTIGGLNCFLTGVIWGVETKTSFWSVLLHGFALFLILLLVNGILVVVPNIIFPSIATTVITFIIGAFAGGFVGKNVAGWWKQEYRKSRLEGKEFYPTIICPSCKKEISEDYQQCPWCGKEQKSTRVQEENLEKLRDVRLPKKNIECPECGREAFGNFRVCPYCGSELRAH